MSDLGRKDLGEQVVEKVTPDSSKTVGEQASEKLTGVVDKAVDALEPESEKSTTQKLGDHTRSGVDEAQNDGQGVLASVQETASGIVAAASDKVNIAADYVTGKSGESAIEDAQEATE